MIKKTLLILIATFVQNTYAQMETDSLKAVLLQTRNDSEKVLLLNKLAQNQQRKDPDKSIQYSEQAIGIAKKGYLSLLAQSYVELSNAHNYKGDYEKALVNMLRAMEIRQKMKDIKGIAKCNQGLSSICYATKQLDKALEYSQLALNGYVEIADSVGAITVYTNMAIIFQEKREYQKALGLYMKAVDFDKRQADKSALISDYSNIGTLYKEQDLNGKALEYFKNALDIAEETGNTRSQAIALINIAYTYGDMHNLSLKEEYLKQALPLAKKIGQNDFVANIYAGLAKVNKEKGNFSMAFEYQELFSDLQDSINTSQNAKQMAEMQSKYEADKKQKELDLKDVEIRKQALVRNFLVGGSMMLLLMAFLLYNRYRLKNSANKKLSIAYNIIEEKNKDITDSIFYAKRIQQAILPTSETMSSLLPEHFVLYQPKDVVSGDFYFVSEKDGQVVFAAIDCTGHGVPGAFMSMIGNSILQETINEKGITNPAKILSILNKGVKYVLKQSTTGSESKDGMDVCLCTLDLKNKTLTYSGAHRPLWIVRDDDDKPLELIALKPNKTSIGGSTTDDFQFEEHTIQLISNDSLYLFSDGYADQFGGPEGKKFMTKKLQGVIMTMFYKDMDTQKQTLHKAFEDWKSSQEQIDDVLIMGVRIV